MLQQNDDWTRIVGILLIQPIVSIIFITIALNLIRKSSNRQSKILSSFFSFFALGFLFNIVVFLIRINPLTSFFYFCTLFCILFSQIFILLFNIIILKTDSEFKRRTQNLIILSYFICILFLLLYSDGIQINEKTNWRPIWTWDFFILIFLFTLSFIAIPTLLLAFKIYLKLTNIELKKKWKFFIYAFLE